MDAPETKGFLMGGASGFERSRKVVVSGVERGLPSTFSVAGSTVSKVAPLLLGTNSPSMKRRVS